MNNLETIKLDFQKEWNSVGVYHSKALIKDLPSWEDILNILNRAIRDKKPRIAFPSVNDFEIVYKDLLAIKKLVYKETDSDRHTIDSDATFFFSLFFNKFSAIILFLSSGVYFGLVISISNSKVYNYL